MDDKEIKDKLTEWDKKSLNKRIERWNQIVPATYDIPFPKLVWSYLSEVDDMYIAGYFVGVVLLCAGITELVLADQIKMRTRMTSQEMERFGLEQLVILGHRLAILDEKETSRLNKIRKLRNYLIHGNAGKLAKMAKKRYRVAGTDDSFLDAGFYLQSGFEEGIDKDALKHLQLVRDLTVRFYSTET